MTSYTVGVGGGAAGGGYFPATSFQYRNVGVTLALTPRVAASGDITLEMAAEFSLLGARTATWAARAIRSRCRRS